MLFLLSPAKSLDYASVLPPVKASEPQFVPQSTELISTLKKKSPKQIAELMDLSDALAQLNVDRYKAWSPTFTEANARPAVLAFNGDVYEGNFTAGKRQGEGTMRYATGESAVGNWENGALTE